MDRPLQSELIGRELIVIVSVNFNRWTEAAAPLGRAFPTSVLIAMTRFISTNQWPLKLIMDLLNVTDLTSM